MTLTKQELASKIDHALLRPELTEPEVLKGCGLAAHYRVVSVCVRPADVLLAAKHLKGTGVEVGTVIGFPHGSIAPEIKLAESKLAIDQGATELDVVVNIGKVVIGDFDYVIKELEPIVRLAHDQNALVKVIFENCYLTDDQKRALCKSCLAVGADYVKTSTGFGSSGATLEDIAIMKEATEGRAKLKAAGGISDLQTAIDFIEAGCERIGCSATADILDAIGE